MTKLRSTAVRVALAALPAILFAFEAATRMPKIRV